MPLKPTHKRALVELITSDAYESPDEMVKALVSTLDELRSADTQYLTVREHAHEGGSAYYGTGPYATFAAAHKAIEKMRAGLPFSGKVAVVPTYSPARVEASAKNADVFPERGPGHYGVYREKAGLA